MKRLQFLIPILAAFSVTAPLWAALPFSDSFTNSDGTPLTTHNSAWVMNLSTMEINSNSLRGNSTTYQTSIAHDESNTYSNDQYAMGTVVAATNGHLVGLVVRAAAGATDTSYKVMADPVGGNIFFYKRVAGVESSVSGGGAYTFPSVPFTLSLEVSGTSLVAKVNGATAISGTDASIASGYAGVAFQTNLTRLDDFCSGDGAAPPSCGGGAATPRRRNITLLFSGLFSKPGGRS